jgi:hypothetical protein
MRHLIVLLVHLITTVLKLIRPGGVRAVVAESVLAKHQLLILNRSRRRSPNLRVLDRIIAGFCSLWIKPRRFCRVAIAFKPSTLLNLHRVLVQRKYRLLFSPKQKAKPGPKGPTADLIRAVVEMKQRNPTWGCSHIAEQINLAFGTAINKDVVRRILDQHYCPAPTEGGPSWLTFIGNLKDSLWSLDLFRCESIALRTYSVLVVMDQYTRRIIGLGSRLASLMAWRSAGCSSKPFGVRTFRNISLQITTRYIAFINGKPILESSVSQKSKRFPISPGPIHLSND